MHSVTALVKTLTKWRAGKRHRMRELKHQGLGLQPSSVGVSELSGALLLGHAQNSMLMNSNDQLPPKENPSWEGLEELDGLAMALVHQ